METSLRALGNGVRAGFSRLLSAAEYRSLRRILFAGLLVRFVLLPITSWGLDTPGFLLGSVSLLGGATPYASHIYFEPPLGAVLQAPLVYLAGPFVHAPLLTFDASIAAVQLRTAIAFAVVPAPLGLVALKLPLVASDLFAALLLFHLVRGRWGLRWAGTATALWWLNPVVIWSSSVVGETDTLAAAFLLVFLFAAGRGAWGLAGWAVGLGAMAKIYPILLLPIGAAWIATLPIVAGRLRLRRFGEFLIGVGLAILPFIGLLQGYGALLAVRGGTGNYGGISLAILYNPASPTFGGHLGVNGGSGGAYLLLGLQAVGVLAAVGAPLLLWYMRRAPHTTHGIRSSDRSSLVVLWSALGSILLLPAPQPENLVGLLLVLAFVLPLLGRAGRLLYVTISVSGLLLVLSELGPLAYFYPLAERLGPGSVAFLNAQVLAYWNVYGLAGHGTYWWIAGMIGGASTLLLWAILGRALWPRRTGRPAPPAREEAVALGTEPALSENSAARKGLVERG